MSVFPERVYELNLPGHTLLRCLSLLFSLSQYVIDPSPMFQSKSESSSLSVRPPFPHIPLGRCCPPRGRASSGRLMEHDASGGKACLQHVCG